MKQNVDIFWLNIPPVLLQPPREEISSKKTKETHTKKKEKKKESTVVPVLAKKLDMLATGLVSERYYNIRDDDVPGTMYTHYS